MHRARGLCGVVLFSRGLRGGSHLALLGGGAHHEGAGRAGGGGAGAELAGGRLGSGGDRHGVDERGDHDDGECCCAEKKTTGEFEAPGLSIH